MLAGAATAMLLVSYAILIERMLRETARSSKRPRFSYIVHVKVSDFILNCPVETAMPSEEVDPDQAGKLDPVRGQFSQDLG